MKEDPSNIHKTRTNMSLEAFLRQAIRGWYWYALALLCFLFLAYRTSHNLVLGSAKYKMAVMSRFSNQDPEITMDTGNKNLLWDKRPAYSVEQVYGILMSSDLIYRAGKEVGFDVDYSQKKFWRTYDVYNDLPFRLIFLDTYDNDELTIQALWRDGKVQLSHPNGFYRGKPILYDSNFQIEIPVGEIVETPVGRISCIAQADPGTYPHTSLDLNLPILVKKIDSNRAKTLFDKDLSLTVNERRTLLLEMAVSGSARRVIEVMSEMIVLCEKEIRKDLRADLEENEKLLHSALSRLELSSENNSAKIKEREYLLQELVRTESNKAAVEMGNILDITDPPSMRPATSASKYFNIILLLLALLLPTLIVYYTRIYPGFILELSQLPKWIKDNIRGKISYQKRQKTSEVSEKELLKMDNVRLEMEGTSEVLVLSSAEPRESLWVGSILATNTARGGRRSLRLHYHPSWEKVPKDCRSIEAKVGYIGSEAFFNDLAALREEYGKNCLFVITASRSLQEQLISFFDDYLLVVVRDKTKLTQLNKLEVQLKKRQSLKEDIKIMTQWVEIPLMYHLR